MTDKNAGLSPKDRYIADDNGDYEWVKDSVTGEQLSVGKMLYLLNTRPAPPAEVATDDAREVQRAFEMLCERMEVTHGWQTEAMIKVREFLQSPSKAEPTEKLAAWMTLNSFATGHGDTFDDLLAELSWQVKEIREYYAQKDGQDGEGKS